MNTLPVETDDIELPEDSGECDPDALNVLCPVCDLSAEYPDCTNCGCMFEDLHPPCLDLNRATSISTAFDTAQSGKAGNDSVLDPVRSEAMLDFIDVLEERINGGGAS